MASTRILVATTGPDAVAAAAAIGRRCEADGAASGDVALRPLGDGGRGTIALLLPALGGETAGALIGGVPRGFARLEGGATALVEAAADPAVTGGLLAAAAASADVVLLAAGDAEDRDGLSARALRDAGGLAGATLVVLCASAAPGGLARVLGDEASAVLEDGARLVADLLDLDEHLARADVVLTAGGGRAAGELQRRCARAGVPLRTRPPRG